MPPILEVPSRDHLNSLHATSTATTGYVLLLMTNAMVTNEKNRSRYKEERRRTGRYVAGGTALAVTLLVLHQLLLRGTSTIAGVCIPAIIMATYVTWVLYSARRDRRKALRLATAMQLTEVISVPKRTNGVNRNATTNGTNVPSDSAKKTVVEKDSQKSRENPAFTNKDELP